MVTDLWACGRQLLVSLSASAVELCSTSRCILLLTLDPQSLDLLPDMRPPHLQRLSTQAA